MPAARSSRPPTSSRTSSSSACWNPATDVEQAYQQHWKDFETGFWEAEVSVGRLRYPRSAIFLNHWLIARTGEEVVAREVFDRFKRYRRSRSGNVRWRSSSRRSIVPPASTGLRHRTPQRWPGRWIAWALRLPDGRPRKRSHQAARALLLDPEQPQVPEAQLTKALDVVESWMVRRMLVRATTKNYSQIIAELVTILCAARNGSGRAISSRTTLLDNRARAATGRTMPSLRRNSMSCPSTDALVAPAFVWCSRRSRITAGVGKAKGRASAASASHAANSRSNTSYRASGRHTGRWRTGGNEAARERIVHTLGNLTLLTGALNSKVSNGPWKGVAGKRQALKTHDVLLLNRDIERQAGEAWSDEAVRARTRQLAEIICDVWKVPRGHRAEHGSTLRKIFRVELSDLIQPVH